MKDATIIHIVGGHTFLLKSVVSLAQIKSHVAPGKLKAYLCTVWSNYSLEESDIEAEIDVQYVTHIIHISLKEWEKDKYKSIF